MPVEVTGAARTDGAAINKQSADEIKAREAIGNMGESAILGAHATPKVARIAVKFVVPV